ncbi:hypothetical protein C0Q70_13480 [Pomacea canaliculata]|uniref:CB1 cannabinoid receptor-interacting protein 1 n=1 Tax=Pomacea canaliculata TaxID=400727 RepID=A0A2T7NXB9_POMCA|nr:CB1 cannabinoid receptor-interacting protein 1-like [Pomacea canaliculata]PVD25817.1 hypothetical protein C0Q70_13480 [Pomacea canaliculata]
MDERLKIRVSVQQWPTKNPVYFKPDGRRFSYPDTLKLRADSAYLVQTLISPGRTLTAMQIRGQTLLLSRLKAGLRHGDSVQYSAIWTTTGYEVNKKGTRTLLPIVLELKGENIVLAMVQCKIYPGEGSGGHWQWGQPLRAIELECSAASDGSYIDVLRQSLTGRRMF